MSEEWNKSVRVSFFIFGVCDFIVLGIYLFYQVSAARIPFWSDMMDLQHTAIMYGDVWLPYLAAAPSFILYFSLFFSIWLFLKRDVRVKWLVTAQLPFRVLALQSSLPFLVVGLRDLLFNINLEIHHSALMIFITLLAVELIKNRYIFIHTRKTQTHASR